MIYGPPRSTCEKQRSTGPRATKPCIFICFLRRPDRGRLSTREAQAIYRFQVQNLPRGSASTIDFGMAADGRQGSKNVDWITIEHRFGDGGWNKFCQLQELDASVGRSKNQFVRPPHPRYNVDLGHRREPPSKWNQFCQLQH